MKRRHLENAMPWLFVGGSLALWEIGCFLFSVQVFILPRPSVVAAALWKQLGPIMDNSLTTLAVTLVGFAIAVALGVLLGVAIGTSRLVYRGLYPVLVGFNSVPKVAVVPVFVIWFGAGVIPRSEERRVGKECRL